MSIRCKIVTLHSCLGKEKASKIYLTISLIITQLIHSDHSPNSKSHSLRLPSFKGRSQCLRQPMLIVLVLETWSRRFDWRRKRLRVCSVDIWATRKKRVLFTLKGFHDFLDVFNYLNGNYISRYKRMEEQPYYVDPNLFANTFSYALTRFPQRKAL